MPDDGRGLVKYDEHVGVVADANLRRTGRKLSGSKDQKQLLSLRAFRRGHWRLMLEAGARS